MSSAPVDLRRLQRRAAAHAIYGSFAQGSPHPACAILYLLSRSTPRKVEPDIELFRVRLEVAKRRKYLDTLRAKFLVQRECNG